MLIHVRTACSVAAWLLIIAALHFLFSQVARAADAAFGQYLAGECVACHRADGQDKGIPAIIGWSEDQFVAVLKAYKDKERANVVMQTIAGKLKDDEMTALAAYYFGLKPKP